MDDDAAALAYAKEVLREHPSATRVSVFEGVRHATEVCGGPSTGLNGSLRGCSVLVAEDRYLLAEDLRRLLHEAGAEVVGPFSDARSAINAARQCKPTCALVDINLGDGVNFDVAEALLAAGVPIVFVTGYDAKAVPDALSHVPFVRKPANRDEILAAVEALCPQAKLSC
jgi:ActR/RegA family two-component response regulator